jgi:hypothetical protein
MTQHHLSAARSSRREREISLGRLLMSRFAEPDARSASVLVDELDAGFFKGSADN